MKDALNKSNESVEMSPKHLYYLYTNLLKKYQKRKSLLNDLKEWLQIYSARANCLNGIGTRCIDHKVCAIERLVEKFASTFIIWPK